MGCQMKSNRIGHLCDSLQTLNLIDDDVFTPCRFLKIELTLLSYIQPSYIAFVDFGYMLPPLLCSIHEYKPAWAFCRWS